MVGIELQSRFLTVLDRSVALTLLTMPTTLVSYGGDLWGRTWKSKGQEQGMWQRKRMPWSRAWAAEGGEAQPCGGWG